MQNQFSRTQLLFGKPAIDTLAGSRVAVFGVGGVGGYVVEVLARSGVGAIDLYDDDRVCLTNVNRQLYALISTIGKHKVDVAAQRVHDINPHCIVRTYKKFYLVSNAHEVDLSCYDYVVDCIDTVSAKMELVRRCKQLGVPILCCMGAANKFDATAFRIADISKTKNDPLAKVMRTECRKRKIKHLKVVYSREPAMTPLTEDMAPEAPCPADAQRPGAPRRSTPGSNAFVPSVAGLIIAGEVIKDLVGFVPLKG